jgi:hypothetical protein
MTTGKQIKPPRPQRNTLYYEHTKTQNFVEKNLIGKPASEIPPTPLYQRGAGGISGRRLALGKTDSFGCGYAAL